MKKTAIFLAAAAVIACAPLFAQESQNIEEGRRSDESVTAFGADLGYFAPFDGDYSGGFTGRVLVDMHYWDPIGVRVVAGYAQTEFEMPGNRDVSTDIMYLSGGIVYTFNMGKVYPYATAGLGLYNFDAPAPAGSETDFGVNFGAGVEIPLAERIYLAPELDFHLITGDAPSSNMAFTLGIRFQIP